MFPNNFAATGVLGLWALSSIPTASAALSWSICSKNEAGVQECRSRIPRGARIAIAICCLIVLILLMTLAICIVKNRRSAKASEQEYNVEASQVDGPPTIIATEYHPNSGPSGVYSGGPKSGHVTSYATGNADGRLSPAPPSYPAAIHEPNMSQHYTAPSSQAAFPASQPYPFTGYSPRVESNAPKTAFVTTGFPRPLLAGNRLKDRLKERPASVSSMTMPEPPPTR